MKKEGKTQTETQKWTYIQRDMHKQIETDRWTEMCTEEQRHTHT